MPLSTNFNVSPYFDDFSIDNKYYRILFKPATAVQARELTQLQTIVQNQIEQFADSIYKPGSVVQGCGITEIPIFSYVRLEDNYANSYTLDLTNFTNYEVQSVNSGLRARVAIPINGAISLYPNTNTLYVSYINSGSNTATGTDIKTFANNETLVIYDANSSLVGNVITYNTRSGTQNTTGIGYGLSVGKGLVYQKGYFISVDSQIVLVSSNAYSVDGLVGGFQTTESIVTYTTDDNLLDNALGYSNENAPGADRVKLVANLSILDSNTAANTANFLPIIRFENGTAIKIDTNPQYSRLGDEIARRNYDSTGNYILKPFNITTAANTASANYIDVLVSPGKGYVKGYPVEFSKGLGLVTTRGIDYLTTTSSISMSYGNFVVVQELAGAFDFTRAEEVQIYDTAQKALTNNLFAGLSPTGNKIGTANIRAVFQYGSGLPGTPTCQYQIYLFNIKMNTGYSFTNNAKALYFSGTAASNRGIADLITNAGQAVLYTSEGTNYNFGFGKKAIRRVANASNARTTSYTVRSKVHSNLGTDGTISFTVTGRGGTTGTETLVDGVGLRQDTAASRYTVVATATNQSANLVGTVTVTGANVVGSSTTFLNHFSAGDYIKFPNTGEVRRVATVVNTTFITLATTANTLAAGNNYYRFIPQGYVFPMSSTMVGTRGINITSTTQATVNTGLNVVGTLASTSNVTIYYDMKRAAAVPAAQTVAKNLVVKIDTSNNSAGGSGPWSLGIPNVHKLNRVYVGSSYSNSNVDYINYFVFDNGQRDTHIELATLSPLPGSPVTANSKIMVYLDAIQPDYTTGTGFFAVDSYPVQDTSPSNTQIYTYEIPVYVNSSGTNMSLRDYVDFRAYKSNTAILANTESGATINPVATTNTFQVDTNSVAGLYVPSPDTNLTSNVEYYVGRQELIYMDQYNNVKFQRGVASENPKPVTPPLELLTLAYMSIKPFPSLTTSEQNTQTLVNRQSKNVIRDTGYMNQVTPVSIRRYTMEDIGTLEERISNLEYYTSLTLLEKAASELQIPSPTTGLNRFKNGFFVETFGSHIYGDISNPDYRVALDIDGNFARPVTGSTHIPMKYSSSVNANTNAGFYTLNLSSEILHFQDQVTEEDDMSDVDDHSATSMYIYPNQIVVVDYGSTPQIQTTTPTAQVLNNTANNANRLNHGTFRAINAGVSTGDRGRDKIISTSSKSIGGTTNLKITGTATYRQTNEQSKTNIVNPYVGSTTLAFKAVGLRPNTVVYAYLDGKNWNAYTQPGLQNTAVTDVTTDKIVYSSAVLGSQLKTNANGMIWGKFTIPPGTTLTGDKIFSLADANTAVITEAQAKAADDGYSTDVSTYAFGHFTASRVIKDYAPHVLYPVASASGIMPVGMSASAAAAGAGAGAGAGAASCFIGDTQVLMANGRKKKISAIKEGDRVFNRDKSTINTVTFVEYFTITTKLYSPVKEYAPFATLDHPIYIDNILSSVDPEFVWKRYPWLGKTEAVVNPQITDSENTVIVYNLWVDGDNTYMVNGFGTTSIIGDGGWLKKIYDLGLATAGDILNLQSRLSTETNDLLLGSYIMNNLYIDNKGFNAAIAKLFLSDNKYIRTLINGIYTTIGFVSRFCKYRR
jgi:hypothetical protein